jgi:cysteinyl-tRNA synthetase
MLMTHYREPIDFTVKRLEEAEDKLRAWQRVAATATGTAAPDASVIEALADDLNFHRASVAMDVIARNANRGVTTAADCLAATLAFFGLPRNSLFEASAHLRGASSMTADGKVISFEERIDAAVAERLAALNARDFARADEIRAALLADGIQLMDGKDEAGQRITKWEVKR